MKQRRMFNKDVIQTDWFTDMPATTQLLYIHLSMDADDDGFIPSIKTALMHSHATKDDLSILIAKNYIIVIEEGLYLVKHWRQNNYLRSDRYKESAFADRLANFSVKEDGSYTQKTEDEINGKGLVYQPETNGIPRLDKIRKDKNRLDENSLVEGCGEKEAIERNKAFLAEKRKAAGYEDDELF